MGVVVVCSIYTTSSMNTILLLLLCWMQTHRSLKSIAIIFSLSLSCARAGCQSPSLSFRFGNKNVEEKRKKNTFFRLSGNCFILSKKQ